MSKRGAAIDAEYEPDAYEVAPKNKRGPKKSKFTEPFVDKLGWNVEPPSLIWRSFGEVQGSAKVAAFNLESTLINRKSSSTFPRDAADWKWWNTATPEKLAALVQEGFKIAIFTNQSTIQGGLDGKGKEKVEAMVEMIVSDLQDKAGGVEVALQCFIAPSKLEGDSCRKPATGMWDFMVQNCSYGIVPDLKASFYVGDASGVADDHSDRMFAAAIGLPFKTPEEVFGPVEGKANISREAVRAAKESVASGANPNTDLVTQLKELAEQLLAAHKARMGGDSLMWKGRAISKAANSISTFPEEVCEANLKAVNALQGVGKGTMARIKGYLATGSVILPEGEEEKDVFLVVSGNKGPATPAAAAPASKKAAPSPAFNYM